MIRASLSILALAVLGWGASMVQGQDLPGPRGDSGPERNARMWQVAHKDPVQTSDLNSAGLTALEQSLEDATGKHDTDGIKSGLTMLERFWSQAVALHNVEAITRIEVEDFICTDPSGAVTGKKDDLEVAKSGALQLTDFKLEDIQVQLHGECAVLTGKTTFNGNTTLDLAVGGSYRWTDVFVHRDGHWQVVASQATIIAQKSDR